MINRARDISYIAPAKHAGTLEQFFTVLQTLDCVSGLQNCLEFSQLPSCLDEAK